MINEHRIKLDKKGEKDTDLLFTLLQAQEDNTKMGKMTDEQLRDEVRTIFLAGHETTSNALGHFICYQYILQLMQDFKKIPILIWALVKKKMHRLSLK
jgi:hypothetical protein